MESTDSKPVDEEDKLYCTKNKNGTFKIEWLYEK